MKSTDYNKLYSKIFKILGTLTPLHADCGQLCGDACCKGDSACGMRLFPHEESPLTVITGEDGSRLAVCKGTCDRTQRPLSCRIFPFFPTVDEKGRVYVEPDLRAGRLCPLIQHSEEILFDPHFFRALKKVGRLLVKDPECREFLRQTTEEIDLYRALLPEDLENFE